MDHLREKIARAVAKASPLCTDMGLTPDSIVGEDSLPLWKVYAHDFDVTLDIIQASGHRIVPVEPTEEMMEAGLGESPTFGFNEPSDVAPVYRAMLTAYGQKEE